MSTTISVRLPDNVAARLKEMARDNCRSVSETIMWILKKYDERELSAQEYCEREPMKSIILNAMKEEGVSMKFEDVFGE